MDEVEPVGGQGSVKKHKKSDVVPPDDFVTDCINQGIEENHLWCEA